MTSILPSGQVLESRTDRALSPGYSVIAVWQSVESCESVASSGGPCRRATANRKPRLATLQLAQRGGSSTDLDLSSRIPDVVSPLFLRPSTISSIPRTTSSLSQFHLHVPANPPITLGPGLAMSLILLRSGLAPRHPRRGCVFRGRLSSGDCIEDAYHTRSQR